MAGFPFMQSGQQAIDGFEGMLHCDAQAGVTVSGFDSTKVIRRHLFPIAELPVKRAEIIEGSESFM